MKQPVSALYANWECKDQMSLMDVMWDPALALLPRKEEDDGMDRTAHQPE